MSIRCDTDHNRGLKWNENWINTCSFTVCLEASTPETLSKCWHDPLTCPPVVAPPAQPPLKLPKRACVSHASVRAGGGVALRINTTAAAADTDKPQTGRKLIERESRRDMDAASASVHSASNNTSDNSTYFGKHPLNNRDCERQCTL